MDLKEFWKEFKERVSSPFFSSFVISWSIFNYQIIIALLFYKQSDLKADGYTSYLNLINNCWDHRYMITYPLIAAILYSLVFKELLRIIQTRISTWADWLILWMTREIPVSAAVHFASEKKLREQIAQYAASVENEGAAVVKNKQLEARNLELVSFHDAEIKKINVENDERIKQINLDAAARIDLIVKDNDQILNDAQIVALSRVKDLTQDNISKNSLIANLNQQVAQLLSSNSILEERDRLSISDKEDLRSQAHILETSNDELVRQLQAYQSDFGKFNVDLQMAKSNYDILRMNDSDTMQTTLNSLSEFMATAPLDSEQRQKLFAIINMLNNRLNVLHAMSH